MGCLEYFAIAYIVCGLVVWFCVERWVTEENFPFLSQFAYDAEGDGFGAMLWPLVLLALSIEKIVRCWRRRHAT